jgi:putative DNA primase/helicase
LLDGDPGLGKSTITIDLAARITNGGALPPLVGDAQVYRPANVIMMSAEDDLRRTIRRRVEAAGADLSRLHVITSMDDHDRLPELPKDIPAIQRVVEQLDAALLVIDPLAAFIGQGVDTHRDSDVRRCLHRLAVMAEETGVAVLLVRHLTKEIGKNAKYRGGGSIGIIGAARSGMLVGEHPDDDNCCVLASTKSNLGPAPTSLMYRIRPAGDTSSIEWLGSTPLSANDVVSPKPAKRPSKVDQCAKLLSEILADEPMEADKATRHCKEAGYSERTIRRARKTAKIAISKVGFDSGWQWSIEGGQ